MKFNLERKFIGISEKDVIAVLSESVVDVFSRNEKKYHKKVTKKVRVVVFSTVIRKTNCSESLKFDVTDKGDINFANI